jgi:hypothetical protein
LWDVEGHLIDTKTYDFDNLDRGGKIKAGEALHEMVIRMTVDSHWCIQNVEAVTEHAPFSICASVAPSFASLAGLSVGPGFTKALRQKFGGTAGCTHLIDLLGAMATTAFQTIGPKLVGRRNTSERPRIIDTCHALAADGPVVARLWPQHAVEKKKV